MASTQENQSRSLWGDLLSFSVYKRNQGRVTRQATFAALAITIAVGVWRLAQLLPLWFSASAAGLPAGTDVESEMAKVSWPTGDEVVRSSAVIIFLIFALSAILAAYDLFWWFVLRYVLKIG